MSRFVAVRFAGLCLVLASVDCARSESSAAATKTVAASGGDVSPAAGAGMAPGLTDSISTRADRGRIRGSEAATVWLVEISDFQCPFCKRWHDETFATLDKEYVQTGKVRMAYLNYPIPSLHPNARAASEAAMCASVQGKFWELHTSLFNTQPAWAKLTDPQPVFDSLATSAGVAVAAWRSCMTSHASLPLIDADHERSGAAGVESTPTFFVGGTRINGAYPVDTFRVAIDRELAKARAGK